MMKPILLLFLLPTSLTGLAQIRSSSTVTFAVKEIQPVKAGAAFDVDVAFKINPGWHVYAPTGVNEEQGMIETKVLLTPPTGIAKAGRVKTSETEFMEGFEVLTGNAIVTQPFRTTASMKPGKYMIKGKLTWQSCSDAMCLPPETQEIAVTVTIN